MADMESADAPAFRVVVNDEEQYSIWPIHKHNAPGWYDVGVEGTKERCLEHIGAVWHDMRPRSLREALQSPS